MRLELVGNKTVTRAALEKRGDDSLAHGRGKSRDEPHVRPMQNHLELARCAKSQRVTARNEKVRHGSIEGSERLEETSGRTEESGELEKARWPLPRADE